MKIFFDLDGTLLEISRKYYKIHLLASQHSRVECLPFKKYWNAKREKIPENEILKISSESEVFKNYEKIRLKLLEDKSLLKLDKPLPEVLRLLKKLKEEHDLYLLTLRRNKENLLHELKMFKMLDCFDRILAVMAGNDAVEAKVKLINKTKYQSSDLIIGDTEADILAAKKLGIISIAVFSGIRSKKFLESYKPDFLFSNVKDYFMKYKNL